MGAGGLVLAQPARWSLPVAFMILQEFVSRALLDSTEGPGLLSRFRTLTTGRLLHGLTVQPRARPTCSSEKMARTLCVSLVSH